MAPFESKKRYLPPLSVTMKKDRRKMKNPHPSTPYKRTLDDFPFSYFDSSIDVFGSNFTSNPQILLKDFTQEFQIDPLGTFIPDEFCC
jgi:hypothetical protein